MKEIIGRRRKNIREMIKKKKLKKKKEDEGETEK